MPPIGIELAVVKVNASYVDYPTTEEKPVLRDTDNYLSDAAVAVIVIEVFL
jgi:hypothetical protein